MQAKTKRPNLDALRSLLAIPELNNHQLKLGIVLGEQQRQILEIERIERAPRLIASFSDASPVMRRQ